MSDPTTLRDRNAVEVLGDQAELNRVALAIETVLGVAYLDALHTYQDQAERLGPTATAGDVLDAAGAAEAVPLVRVLEIDQSRAQRMLEAAAKPGERVDDQGHVLLPTDADHGKLLADPQEVERRLARARRHDQSYAGDDGRARFLAEDRAAVQHGWDLPRSLEREAEVSAARAQAQSESAKVTRPLTATREAREEKRELEQRVRDLDRRIRDGEARDADMKARGVVDPNAVPVGRLLEARHEATRQLVQVQGSRSIQLDSIPGYAIMADAPSGPAAPSHVTLDSAGRDQRLVQLDAVARYRETHPDTPILEVFRMAHDGEIS